MSSAVGMLDKLETATQRLQGLLVEGLHEPVRHALESYCHAELDRLRQLIGASTELSLDELRLHQGDIRRLEIIRRLWSKNG